MRFCVKPESFLSSLMMMTRPDLEGRCWSLMRIALRSSMVHPDSLCQGKDQIAHILLSCPFHHLSTIVAVFVFVERPLSRNWSWVTHRHDLFTTNVSFPCGEERRVCHQP